VAASLRADAGDLATGLEVLAAKLERALPGRVRVERGGVFRGKRVERVDCDLGETRYSLAAGRGLPEARRAKVVRGVTLKTEELDLDAWIQALARELAEEAQTSEQARLALGRLLES
jgi:hypothetical protein